MGGAAVSYARFLLTSIAPAFTLNEDDRTTALSDRVVLKRGTDLIPHTEVLLPSLDCELPAIRSLVKDKNN